MEEVSARNITVDGNLSIGDVVKVARRGAGIKLDPQLREKIKKARRAVDQIISDDRVVYGINTGFGKFCDVTISSDKSRQLQKNLISSHAAGVGPAFDQEIVRAIMLLRLNALALGYSGIREEVINLLVEMLNQGVHPVIPSQGSLGASGDLAPLSHMALVLTGKGEAFYRGRKLKGNEALKAAGLQPVELQEKEGLALINGTQVMTALGAMAVYDAVNLCKSADIISSLSLETLKARWDAFDMLSYQVRPHPGHGATLRNLQKLLQGSQNLGSNQEKVQDAYSTRCSPQVHGATKDALEHVKKALETEINSVTDNPLVYPEENRVISAGNFHGQPIALAMDYFALALAELGSISERRLERLLNTTLSGLPPFLTTEGGLNSGYMIAQYTAASLASENKVYAHPASADSLPVSANQEDHVSMGTSAARKALQVVHNVTCILGTEYLAGVQALELCGSLGLGEGSRIACQVLREVVPFLKEDRELHLEMESSASLIREEKLVESVESRFPLEPSL